MAKDEDNSMLFIGKKNLCISNTLLEDCCCCCILVTHNKQSTTCVAGIRPIEISFPKVPNVSESIILRVKSQNLPSMAS